MTIDQHGGKAPEAQDQLGELRLWSLSKIDLRSPVLAKAWPIARLELIHPVRGRVTDIGTAPGAFDAAFVAAGHIIGFAPRLLSYNVESTYSETESALQIQISVELEMDGQTRRSTCSGVDLLRCSLTAWLDAAAQLAVLS